VRRFIVLMLAWAVCVAGGDAWAQAYPARPIRLVVPFPPGGNVDTFARMLAQQLETQLGHPLVIDNRGGANGIVGCDIVAKAPPDGYTILATSFSFVVNPSIYKQLPYDVVQDFTPITAYALGLGYLLTANPALPAQSVKELIALGRNKDNPLRYSSAGIGNGTHLAAELFSLKAGIQMLHIPYKGGGPAVNAALGGEVQITFPAVAVGAPFVKAGRLRALGFTGAARVASLPEVPTIAEAGLPGFQFDSGWHAMFAPAKLPPAVLARLYTEVRKALEVPKVREFLAAGGYEARADPPPEFQKRVASDVRLYAEVVKAAKISPQ
jgi:tripartite-type tricarboxylate transporter receptor subunit TctC